VKIQVLVYITVWAKSQADSTAKAKYRRPVPILMCPELEETRKELDRITTRIVRLIERRVELCNKVSEIKKKQGMPVLDISREEELVEALLRQSTINDKDSLRKLLREVISMCRSAQKTTSVVIPGFMEQYSREAALRVFGMATHITTAASVDQAFLAVQSGGTDFLVTPYEDTIRGGFPLVLDSLVTSDLRILAEVVLGVHYRLVSYEASLDKVTTVYADVESFYSCERTIRHVLPGAKVVVTQGPPKRRVRGAAFLVGEYEASSGRMNTLISDVQDQKDHTCRFVVLGKEGSAIHSGRKGLRYKSTLAFTADNRPGGLSKILSEFSRREINLTMIASRPLRGRSWNYAFLVDLEVEETDERFRDALKGIAGLTTALKVFGSYPVVRASDAGNIIQDWPPSAS
jgi:chorismate mutase/prephenate dehydratase